MPSHGPFNPNDLRCPHCEERVEFRQWEDNVTNTIMLGVRHGGRELRRAISRQEIYMRSGSFGEVVVRYANDLVRHMSQELHGTTESRRRGWSPEQFVSASYEDYRREADAIMWGGIPLDSDNQQLSTSANSRLKAENKALKAEVAQLTKELTELKTKFRIVDPTTLKSTDHRRLILT